MNALTDEQLRRARERLTERRAVLHERVQRVRQDLRREREPLPGSFGDAAIAIENDDVLHAIEDSSARELDQIARALVRLEAGEFGVCERCGKLIDPQRLDVVPYASRCGGCEPEH